MEGPAGGAERETGVKVETTGMGDVNEEGCICTCCTTGSVVGGGPDAEEGSCDDGGCGGDDDVDAIG